MNDDPSPVDLHFLHLPLEDGNLSISRSPIKDSAILQNLFQIPSRDGILSRFPSSMTRSRIQMVLYWKQTFKFHLQVKDAFMNAIGHRWAKIGELSLANEASTAWWNK